MQSLANLTNGTSMPHPQRGITNHSTLNDLFDDGLAEEWSSPEPLTKLVEPQSANWPQQTDEAAPAQMIDCEARFEFAVQAMLRSCKPIGAVESTVYAQKRLQAALDICVLFDLNDDDAMDAVSVYAESFPLPGDEHFTGHFPDENCTFTYCLDYAKDRIRRGEALIPTGIAIVVGDADRNGDLRLVAKYDELSHSDYLDPRRSFQLEKFCVEACRKLGLVHAETQFEILVRQAISKGADKGLKKYGVMDLLQKFPVRRPSVIDGLAREGETMSLISHSKVGKSWQCCQLALSVISGLPWLRKFPVSRGRVLILDNELTTDELAHRFRVVANAMGIEPAEMKGQIEIWSLRESPRSLENLQVEFDAIEPGTFRLVVLDAEYKLLPQGISENDNCAMAQFHGRVSSIATRLGALVVLVHHTTKGSQIGKRLTDIGAGAGAQSRAVDCHLVLQEHEKDGIIVLRAAVRSYPPVEPVALQHEFPVLVAVDDVDASQLRIEPTGSERRQQKNNRDGKEAVLKSLRENGPATRRQLRTRTGMGDTRLERLLDILVEQDHSVSVAKAVVVGNNAKLYSAVGEEKPGLR